MKTRIGIILGTVAVALMTACGGSGGPGDDGKLDLAGTWTVTMTVTQNTCGPVLPPQTFQTQVQQSGDQIRFQDNLGSQYVAVVDGNSIRFSGEISQTQQGCGITVNYSGTSTALSETRIEANVTTRTRYSGGGCILNGRTCDLAARFTMTR